MTDTDMEEAARQPLIIDSIYAGLPVRESDRDPIVLLAEGVLTSVFYGDMWDMWAQVNQWPGYVSQEVRNIAESREINQSFDFDFSEVTFTTVSSDAVADDPRRLDVADQFASVQGEVQFASVAADDLPPEYNPGPRPV